MRRSLAVLATAALFFAGCADSGSSGPDPAEDPKGALQSALESLANSEGTTMTLTLQSTEESLVAASEGELTEDQASDILGSSLVVSAAGETPEDSSFELLLNVAGTEGLEVKSVDQEVYLRADIPGLAETIGDPIENLEQAVQGFEAQGLTFARPAVEGEWLHLVGAKEAAEQLGVAPSPTGDPSKLQEEAANALSEALDESATVTSEGSDDVGEHLVASVKLRSFYNQISEKLPAIANLPGGQMPPATEVPDAELAVDVWIADDTVQQISFDLLQLSQLAEDPDVPEGVEELAMQLTFDPFDGEVEVPGDAVEVNVQQLFQQMFMGQTQVESGSQTISVPGDAPQSEELCAQLEEAPDDVKKEFVDQCPDLVP